LHTHLKIEQNEKVRYGRNSCRDITNKINQTNIGLHSAICAKALQKILTEKKTCLSIWRIKETTNEVVRHNFEPTKWEQIKVLSWEVYIDIWLIKKMQDYRQSKLPNETGGILIGSIDNERKIIYLFDTIFAPIDSIEEKDGFIRGTDGLVEEYQNYLSVTDNQILYLGEWHSHPTNYSTNPSKLDSKLFRFLAINLGSQGYPAIMCIVNDKNYNIQIGLNYERIN
jgi:integrative and conjugative element protein (TIGR02256 family)